MDVLTIAVLVFFVAPIGFLILVSLLALLSGEGK
jgi:hypothetical protein